MKKKKKRLYILKKKKKKVATPAALFVRRDVRALTIPAIDEAEGPISGGRRPCEPLVGGAGGSYARKGEPAPTNERSRPPARRSAPGSHSSRGGTVSSFQFIYLQE